MQYILGRHNRIVRKYARGGYCVTDRGNKPIFRCATLAEAEAFIDSNPEGMSIPHGSWQEDLWNMLKAGITVTPMQHGAASVNTARPNYKQSWEGMCKRIEIAGYQLEQTGQGDQVQYKLVREQAAN